MSASRMAERVREAAVLDHWASFGSSYDELIELLMHLATGGSSGRRPRSIILLSGDVHHCYLAAIRLTGVADHAPIWQAVCSPYRKQLSRLDRAAMGFGASRTGARVGRALIRATGVRERPVEWELVEEPSWDNQLGVLRIAADGATLRVETTVGSDFRAPALQERFHHRLA